MHIFGIFQYAKYFMQKLPMTKYAFSKTHKILILKMLFICISFIHTRNSIYSHTTLCILKIHINMHKIRIIIMPKLIFIIYAYSKFHMICIFLCIYYAFSIMHIRLHIFAYNMHTKCHKFALGLCHKAPYPI